MPLNVAFQMDHISRIVIRGVKNSTAVPLGLVSPYVSPLS